MAWYEIVSAICIFLSAGVFSYSLLRKTKGNILVTQMFSSSLYILSYVFIITTMLSATVGLITAVFEMIRVLVFYAIEKSEKYNTTKINITFSVIFSVILSTAAAFAWQGWISLLPLIGTVVNSFALGSKNVYFIKFAGIFAAILVGIYFLVLNLPLNALSQVVVIGVTVFGLIYTHIMSKKKACA